MLRPTGLTRCDRLPYRHHEAVPERLQLPVADARHFAKLVQRARTHARHVPQRRVGEDQIRRHAPLLLYPPPQRALENGADGLALQWKEPVVAPDAPYGLVDELRLDDAAIIAEGNRPASTSKIADAVSARGAPLPARRPRGSPR